MKQGYRKPKNAAEILGISARENLKMKDGFLINSERISTQNY